MKDLRSMREKGSSYREFRFLRFPKLSGIGPLNPELFFKLLGRSENERRIQCDSLISLRDSFVKSNR